VAKGSLAGWAKTAPDAVSANATPAIQSRDVHNIRPTIRSIALPRMAGKIAHSGEKT
jgi:hypothetical protein